MTFRLSTGAMGLLLVLLAAGCSTHDDQTTAPPTEQGPPIRLLFGSNRPPSTVSGNDLYFSDRLAKAYLPVNLNTLSDEGPLGMSADGKWVAFNSGRQVTGSLASMFLYDAVAHEIHLPQAPTLYSNPLNPTLSGDGSRMAFQYKVGVNLFDLTVALVDVATDLEIPTPQLHVTDAGEFDPALTADGKFIAFTSTRDGGFGVYLYSVEGDSTIDLPGLNTAYSETGVAVNADASRVAFHSNRPGGRGLFDVYVWERSTGQVMVLPGANSPLSEINPALSPDGRWLAYTSENDGAGNIRLYDLQEKKLVTLTGINDPYFVERYVALANLP